MLVGTLKGGIAGAVSGAAISGALPMDQAKASQLLRMLQPLSEVQQ